MTPLQLLHDATLHEIRYDCTDPNSRVLTFSVTMDDDLGEPGFDEWSGKDLVITARGVFLVRFAAWGYVVGEETIAAWQEGVSPEVQSDAEESFAPPAVAFTVVFHSGSTIEVICEVVEVRSAEIR